MIQLKSFVLRFSTMSFAIREATECVMCLLTWFAVKMCFFSALLLVPGDWSNYWCLRLYWMVMLKMINIFVAFLLHFVAKQGFK